MRGAVAASLATLARSRRWLDYTIGIRGRRYPVRCRLGDLGDYQSTWECLGRMYEPPAIPISYIFDAGGNIGLFTLAKAAQHNIAEIVIVEPDPDNFTVLKHNLAAFPRAVTLCAALGAQEGTASFIRNSSNTGYLAAAADMPSKTTTVPVRKVSELIPKHWILERTWMKLDIEGAEYAVLPEMLAAGVRPGFISAEIHDYFNLGGDGVVERLSQAGYKIDVIGYGSSGNVCRQISAQRMG
jgi:FkbM family methyltransferase